MIEYLSNNITTITNHPPTTTTGSERNNPHDPIPLPIPPQLPPPVLQPRLLRRLIGRDNGQNAIADTGAVSFPNRISYTSHDEHLLEPREANVAALGAAARTLRACKVVPRALLPLRASRRGGRRLGRGRRFPEDTRGIRRG